MPGIANAFYYLTNWLVLNREINSLVHEGTINLTMWAGKNSHMGLYCLCNSKCSSSNYLWFCSIEFLSSNCLLFKYIVSIDKIIVVDSNIKDSISNIWVSCQSLSCASLKTILWCYSSLAFANMTNCKSTKNKHATSWNLTPKSQIR